MKKTFKLVLVALTVMALMLTAVGCGNEEPADKKLIVSFEPTFAPFESTGEDGEFAGFDIDLINAIAEAEGMDIELKSLGFDGLIPALETGQIDIAISGMTIKPDRVKKVDFSIPYYEAGLVIAVPMENENIVEPKDLAGKKMAVQIGTTGADMANKFAGEYGATVKTYNTTDLVFMELINGGVDAVVNDKPVTQDFIRKRGQDRVKIVGDVLEGESYGIAVAKGNTELLDKINSGLNTIKENGKFAEIYQEWFEVSPPDYLPGEPN